MKATRQFKYDLVRFVAMTWVIAVHALVVVDTGRRLGIWYMILGQAFFFTANAIFFMLSGKFNLTRRNAEDWKGFYLRKTKSILLPIAVLFLLRTAYNLWPDFGLPLHFAKAYALNSLDEFSSCEYWFVFQLVSMLAVTPFLIPVVESFDHRKKKLFIYVGIIWFTFRFFLTNLGVELGYSFLFGGFWFSYLVGSFIEEFFSSARRRRALALCSFVAPLLAFVFYLFGYTSGAFDNSPFYLAAYVSLYFLLLWCGEKVKRPFVKKFVSFGAKHSFTVYMIHMMILKPIIAAVPTLYGISSLAEHVVISAVTLVICLLTSVVIDSLIISPLQKFFDLVCRRLNVKS